MSGTGRARAWLLVAAGIAAASLTWTFVRRGGPWGTDERGRASQDDEGADRTAAAPDRPSSGPRLVSAAAAEREIPHGPVMLRVIDGAGRPVVGSVVTAHPSTLRALRWTSDAQVALDRRTDPSGQVAYTDLPYDGGVVLRATPNLTPDEEAKAEDAWIRVKATPLRARIVEDGQSIRFVPDGSQPELSEEVLALHSSLAQQAVEEGRALRRHAKQRGAVEVTGPRAVIEVDRGLPIALEVREGTTGALRSDALADAWPRWGPRPDDGQHAAVLVAPGQEVTVHGRVVAPRGWVSCDDTSWAVQIHPHARRLLVVHPLRPELDLVLDVPQECRPTTVEQCALTVRVANHAAAERTRSLDAQGRVRVPGAPFLPGDRVRVSGDMPPDWYVTGRAYLGNDPRAQVVVPLSASRIEDGFHNWEAWWETNRFDRELDLPKPPRVPSPTRGLRELLTARVAPASANLDLRVIDWRGLPAEGALVTLAGWTLRADAQGRVRFSGVFDATAKVRVLGAGPGSTYTLALPAEGRTEHLLTVSAGGTLDVDVVDRLGRRLPYPHIALEPSDGTPHLDCIDGVQRLDAYGDHEGRRTFRFVTPGVVDVTAWFGSRAARVQAVVPEDGHVSARVVLPVHEAPPPQPPAPDGTPR